MARTLIPGWVDWWLCSVRGGRISDRLRAGVPLPPPPPAFFFLCSLCFVGFAAYWSGPCGLYRDHLLHFVGFIKATPWPLGLTCLTLAWRLACAWLVAAGVPDGRSGVPVASTPVYQILYKSQVLIGFCGSRLLWGRLALTCGSGQARRQNSTVETNPCHCV